MTESHWLEIDLRRLDENLTALRRMLEPPRQGVAGARFCGVVKANAYGLGAVPIAQRLAQRGADMLAVYSAEQAAELVQAGIVKPILVLGVMDELDRTDPLYRAAVTGRLHLSIHSLDQLRKVADIGRTYGASMPVHLHLDTGMSRGGFHADAFAQALAMMPSMRHVRLAGIATHMASSDDHPDFTAEQFHSLETALRDHRARIGENVIIHAANTFTMLRHRRYHCGMVRVGIGLCGFGAEVMSGGPLIDNLQPLRHVVRWCSRLVHVARYRAGCSVGYNQTCRLERDSVLGVVPVGYGDGYKLALSGKGCVAIPPLSSAAPILGRVNMDQIVVDLTDLAAGANTGTLVELYSHDPASPCSVPRLAALAGSQCYDMLTGLNPRIPRHYVR